jgi:hypothetical protein
MIPRVRCDMCPAALEYGRRSVRPEARVVKLAASHLERSNERVGAEDHKQRGAHENSASSRRGRSAFTSTRPDS